MRVSVQQYAKMIGKSRQTVYNMIRAKKLQTEDCCGVIKIYVADQRDDKEGIDSSHAGLEGDKPSQ